MGYGYYLLPDGREAGYGVEAECDHPDCSAEIDRGLAYLCGESPDGHRDPEEPGCGRYFCGGHQIHDDHDCANSPDDCPDCGGEGGAAEEFIGSSADVEIRFWTCERCDGAGVVSSLSESAEP